MIRQTLHHFFPNKILLSNILPSIYIYIIQLKQAQNDSRESALTASSHTEKSQYVPVLSEFYDQNLLPKTPHTYQSPTE